MTLIGVGALTAVGFASVYIARQSVISAASLSYAGVFLGVYLLAHLVARATVPRADPYLLPIAGLLTAVGITEIYRLDPTDAFRQGLWVVIGVALFALTLFFLRGDYRRLENYRYLFGVGAVVSARAAGRFPESARPSTAPGSGSSSGRCSSSRARSRKSA